MPLLIWLAKTAILIVVFHLIVPPLVNAQTKNSWIKLPVMLLLGLCAGIAMTWLHYMPFILAIVWLALSRHTLAIITNPDFEEKLGRRVQPAVHLVSTYAYVLVACLSAWVLQIEIGGDDPGKWTPVWKHVLDVF